MPASHQRSRYLWRFSRWDFLGIFSHVQFSSNILRLMMVRCPHLNFVVKSYIFSFNWLASFCFDDLSMLMMMVCWRRLEIKKYQRYHSFSTCWYQSLQIFGLYFTSNLIYPDFFLKFRIHWNALFIFFVSLFVWLFVFSSFCDNFAHSNIAILWCICRCLFASSPPLNLLLLLSCHPKTEAKEGNIWMRCNRKRISKMHRKSKVLSSHLKNAKLKVKFYFPAIPLVKAKEGNAMQREIKSSKSKSKSVNNKNRKWKWNW